MSRFSAAPALFEPVTVGSLTLRNRVVMAPMTRQFSPSGIPSEEVGDYYVRRAEGGAALLMTEGLDIGHPVSVHQHAVPNFYTPEALDAWARIARRVQAAGAAFVPQLWHVGGARSALADVPYPGAAAVSPSGVYTPGRQYGPPASDGEIAAVVDAYADAATAALRIGCDGIDIHGAHGYLIDQFLWEATNHRADGYGGDVRGRTRFAAEVVAECRRRTSPTFPIFFRFSQWKLQNYDARPFPTPADLESFLGVLVSAGVDVFDCSTRRFWTPEFEGSDLNLAAWTRRLSGRPTMAVGSVGLDSDVVASLHGREEVSNISSLEILQTMLARGDFDLVGVGRALLADPQWTRKVADGDLGALRGFRREHLDVLS